VPRRSAVERLPQRAIVIGSHAPSPSLLDVMHTDVAAYGRDAFERAVPVMRSGGVLITATQEMVLRAAIGPPGGQITEQLRVLEALADRAPDPAVSERIAWPLDSGTTGLARWSIERRLAGRPPDGPLSRELLSECIEFLMTLHEARREDDEDVSLADCAAAVAPYRPNAVAGRLQALGEQLDSALSHLPRGFGHGDFFTGNLLVEGDRLHGVIDWDGGGPGRLPLLDLIHLRHMVEHPLPDEDWGRSVVEHLIPWARQGGDALTRRYCAAVGFEPDPETLEALVLAYWLDRLGYQIRTHRYRHSQERWLARNVDLVLHTVPGPPASGTDLVALTPNRSAD
jgi:aminoglycoside phosphotransferase (APT) family kinase protein